MSWLETKSNLFVARCVSSYLCTPSVLNEKKGLRGKADNVEGTRCLPDPGQGYSAKLAVGCVAADAG